MGEAHENYMHSSSSPPPVPCLAVDQRRLVPPLAAGFIKLIKKQIRDLLNRDRVAKDDGVNAVDVRQDADENGGVPPCPCMQPSCAGQPCRLNR